LLPPTGRQILRVAPVTCLHNFPRCAEKIAAGLRSSLSARRSVPHSAFRVPHFLGVPRSKASSHPAIFLTILCPNYRKHATQESNRTDIASFRNLSWPFQFRAALHRSVSFAKIPSD